MSGRIILFFEKKEGLRLKNLKANTRNLKEQNEKIACAQTPQRVRSLSTLALFLNLTCNPNYLQASEMLVLVVG